VGMIQRKRSDRERLGKIIGENRFVRCLFVPDIIGGKKVVQITMQLVSPLENILCLPRETVERWCDDRFIRRGGGVAVDKRQDLLPCLFDCRGLVSTQQRLGETRVSEVDPVKLRIEVWEVEVDRPIPRPTEIKDLVPLLEPFPPRGHSDTRCE